MTKELIRLATYLDDNGLYKEADDVDALIKNAQSKKLSDWFDPLKQDDAALQFFNALKMTTRRRTLYMRESKKVVRPPDHAAVVKGFDVVYEMLTRASEHEGQEVPRGFFSKLYEKYGSNAIIDMLDKFDRAIWSAARTDGEASHIYDSPKFKEIGKMYNQNSWTEDKSGRPGR